MGASQSSTSKAGKFSGATKRQRACSCYEGANTSSAPQIRRNVSNINRNAKEFSKFWQNGGNFQPSSTSVRRRGSSAVQRSQSARRPRSMSIDPTVRSPPRIVPSGNAASVGQQQVPQMQQLQQQHAPPPPPSVYNTPRESYRNETLERRGAGLNRVHSVKYNTYSPPARCNGMQAAPTTPTSLYQRHPNASYRRGSVNAACDVDYNYRTTTLPRMPVNTLYDADLHVDSRLRQTSIY